MQLHAKLRFTTMVILPEQEQILISSAATGFWMVRRPEPRLHQPAKAGASTNLNSSPPAVTSTSFVLTEGNGHRI